jgi:hypothetical protein
MNHYDIFCHTGYKFANKKVQIIFHNFFASEVVAINFPPSLDEIQVLERPEKDKFEKVKS